jgi:hypothetical protein
MLLQVLSMLYLGLLGCNKDDGAVWVRFNGDEDLAELQVTAGLELGEDVVVDLTSTTGATVVGTATLTPGSGPVGTDHRVLIALGEDYSERVQRVEVVVDSGARGERTFSFDQDSADLWKWVLDLTSYGVDGEERIDTLSFELYEVQDAPLPEIEEP